MKYEILKDKENTIEFEGRTLYRIRALKDFSDVKIGDIGGYVSDEDNLSQEGNCWIYDNAKCMDNSRMYNNAKMFDDSIMCNNATMYGNSVMFGNSRMCNNAKMYGDSKLKDNGKLYGNLYSKVDNFIEIINPKGRLVTGVLKNGKILFNVGCQTEITKETFIDRIYNKGEGIEGNPHRKEYLKIIKAIEMILAD